MHLNLGCDLHQARNGAGLLDRLFKDILSEQDDEIELQPFVDLVAERMSVGIVKVLGVILYFGSMGSS